MFEELSLSVGDLLFVLFSLILLFSIVYGAISVGSVRAPETLINFPFLSRLLKMKNLSRSLHLFREMNALVV